MPAPSRPHLLLVDDDPSIREGLALALTGAYTVHAAATGTEACALLQTRPVAGIVLDAILGEEHGLDYVDRFRALSHAPILLLTGYGSEDLAVRALRAKVGEYLKKPVNLHDLHSALARLLSNPGLPADPMTHVQLHLGADPEGQFTARDLAQHVGLSDRQLRRRFRETYGETPWRRLTDLRLRRAAALLCTTGLGIKQIAQQIGCPNVAWFDKLFKRAYGLTPSEFRSRHRTPQDG